MKPWLKVAQSAAYIVTLPYTVALLIIFFAVKIVMLPFEKPRADEMRDYTNDAEAIFTRFAERHGLTYEIDTGVPMEVCWTFPEQPKLSMPLTLGLQNCDELNFGVSDFWSYFFPFDEVADEFETILDAWVAGDARVAITGFRSRLLQVRKGGRWRTAYGADGFLFPLRWTPVGYVTNEQRFRCPTARPM